MTEVTEHKKKNWFARHKFLTVLLVIVGLIIAVSAIGGSSNTPSNGAVSSDGSTSSNNDKKEVRFTDRADQQKSDVELAVGESGVVEGIKLTVNSTEAKPSLGEYTTAASGKTFIVANVTLENVGDKAQPYNGFDFRIQTTGGQVLDQSFMGDSGTALSSGDIVQGGKVTGNVTFEVPVEEGNQYIIWKPNAFKSDRGVIQVQK